jgi:transposase
MLQINPHIAYYWYHGAADMRKSFDGLSGLVHQQMQQRVLSGSVFIFMNRKRNQVKILTWEGDGLSIYYKRLEKGVYDLPVFIVSGTTCVQMDALQLQLILQGVILSSVRRKKRFSFPLGIDKPA